MLLLTLKCKTNSLNFKLKHCNLNKRERVVKNNSLFTFYLTLQLSSHYQLTYKYVLVMFTITDSCCYVVVLLRLIL